MRTVAVAAGSRKEILNLVKSSRRAHKEKVKFIIFDTEADIDTEGIWDYRPCFSEKDMIRDTVRCVSAGEADILLKGGVNTHSILKEVLKAEYGLKQKNLLSHVALVSIPAIKRQILLTDAGMNISPNPEQLSEIIENVLDVCDSIGLSRPKVALLSAAENINPKMSSSVVAQQLTAQYKDDRRAVIYGPVSLDLALSEESVELKRFSAPIQGDADVLVVPGIDAGNVLYKALLLFAGAKIGGTIVGTRVPIVLTSRSDKTESKLYALDFALMQLDSSSKNIPAGESR